MDRAKIHRDQRAPETEPGVVHEDAYFYAAAPQFLEDGSRSSGIR
jgi:hypothetical protein